MSGQLAKYRISADEYERMGEAGIFDKDDRLELLEGSIYERSHSVEKLSVNVSDILR